MVFFLKVVCGWFVESETDEGGMYLCRKKSGTLADAGFIMGDRREPRSRPDGPAFRREWHPCAVPNPIACLETAGIHGGSVYWPWGPAHALGDKQTKSSTSFKTNGPYSDCALSSLPLFACSHFRNSGTSWPRMGVISDESTHTKGLSLPSKPPEAPPSR